MKVLITGAGGFVGRATVVACLQRGLSVRALVRHRTPSFPPWCDAAEVYRADLRLATDLRAALQGVEAVIHLAARMNGTDEQRFADTVVGTERLLAAMARSGVERMVLASSVAVYDWSGAHGVLTEDSPLESHPYERDGYAVSKLWQERVVRRAAQRGHLHLTVLRPGRIWGPGNLGWDQLGPQIRGIQFVIGPRRILPITYVENCADCFVEATSNPGAVGQTLNVVDPEPVSAWQFASELRRRARPDVTPIPVPYAIALHGVRALHATARRAGRARLPSLLVPRRFDARFRPVAVEASRVMTALGWRPRYSFFEALANVELTYRTSDHQLVRSTSPIDQV